MTEDCPDVHEGTPIAFRHRPPKRRCLNLHNQHAQRLWRAHGQQEPTAYVLLDTNMLGRYDDDRESHPMHEGHLHIQWALCCHRIMEGLKHSGFSQMDGDCPIDLSHSRSQLLDGNCCQEA